MNRTAIMSVFGIVIFLVLVLTWGGTIVVDNDKNSLRIYIVGNAIVLLLLIFAGVVAVVTA